MSKAEEYEICFLNNIRRRREQMGLSLAELSSRSGLPLEMLEELDRGVIPDEMMLDAAFKLAKVFHCKAYELFD